MIHNAGGRAGRRFVTAGTLMLSLVSVSVRTEDPDPRTLKWMQSVLDAWQVNARRDVHTALQSPPWIYVYDASTAWHLNPDTTRLPSHTSTKATLRYANRRYTLARVANDRKLWVPDRDSLPLTPRSVTMVHSNGQKTFT